MRAVRIGLVVSLVLPLACGKSVDLAPPRMPASETALRAATDDVPYGRAPMKTTHNAYDRDEPLLDQLVYHGIRSLELDVHTSRARTAAPDGQWFVYHADLPFFRDSSCATLTDCLGQIAAFHEAVPRHDVVTLFVDLKDDVGGAHAARELDAALEASLGRDAIVRPADLLARCPGARSVREAVTGACAFPTLGELRGKFVVAVTGGSLCDGQSHVAQYGGADATSRTAFLAPQVSGACTAERYDARGDVVFFNMALSDRRHAAAVRERGLVARVYGGGVAGGLDSAADFLAARTSGAALLATDDVNAEASPWAATGARGAERAELLAARGLSGDVGGAADSAFFAYERDAGASIWSSLVSVASSFVEPLAKGCLMARASEAPDAAAVSLCRPLDHDPPRLVVRAAKGALATTIELQDVLGVSAETPAFLRLAVTPRAGGATDVRGEASADGKVWRTIARATVAAALPLRGVAIASSGPAAVKALFGNLRRTRDGGAPEVLRAASLIPHAIGARTTGDLVDGG